MSEGFRCPTCRAPWRGVATCQRCGADLALPMRVAARAWELREAARTALWAGDRPAEALVRARASCRLHATPRGQRLLALVLVVAGQREEARVLIERLLSTVRETPESSSAPEATRQGRLAGEHRQHL